MGAGFRSEACGLPSEVAKKWLRRTRDHEEAKHAKQKDPEKLDGTLGPANLFYARLGRPEEDREGPRAFQTRRASEICPGTQVGAEPTGPGSYQN
jgi:hypothetical protein